MALRGRPPTKFNKPIRDPDIPRRAPPREPVNFDLLTEDDKVRLLAEAEARVAKREKERAEDAYLELQELKIAKRTNPESFQEDRTITIDLALYADDVNIDGRRYEKGRTYTVTKSVYDTLVEVAQRTFRHEHEIKSGDPYNSYYTRQRFRNMAEATTPYASVSPTSGVQMHNSAPARF